MIRNERTARMLAGILIVPSFLFLGIAAGVWIATLNPTGMGWDQLADALGGLMLGGLAGLILAVIVITKLPRERLLGFTILTLIATVGLSSTLAIRARNRAAARAAADLPTAVTPDPKPAAPAATTPAPPADAGDPGR